MPEKTGLTRRDLLKRGGLLGAVAWATPVVQVVGMRPAHAMQTSPVCGDTYCIKWETPGAAPDFGTVSCTGDEADGARIWSKGTGWSNLGGGQGTGKGNCQKCPSGGKNSLPSDIGDFWVYGDPTTGLWVSYPSTYQFDLVMDPSENLLTGASKCGSGAGSCGYLRAIDNPITPEVCVSDGVTRLRAFFPVCANGKGISHIEMIIKDCS